MIILAVETSCDETSVAIVKDGKTILSNQVLSQIDIHKKFGGVVPEVASRNHIIHITQLFKMALLESELTADQIDLVAVTKGPGLIGSLLVGINAAQAFAYAHNKPLIGVNHLFGHIYAANIEHELKFPSLCLLVSGGHTELIYLKNHFEFELLGETLDDAVGEAYDKVARILGIPYPGGPLVDKLAKEGKPTYKLPIPLLKDESYNFSFSGLKSAVKNLVHNLEQKELSVNVNDMCASFQNVVSRVLVEKTKLAARHLKVEQIILAGGVAANSALREKMKNAFAEIEVIYPTIQYCTDQAAMIGVAAYFQNKKFGNNVDYYLKANAGLNL